MKPLVNGAHAIDPNQRPLRNEPSVKNLRLLSAVPVSTKGKSMVHKVEPNEPIKTRPSDPFPLITKFTDDAIYAIEAGRPNAALKILSVLRKFSDLLAREDWWDKL